MNQNIPNDLLWTAYQYAVGELPEPAAREFENRLEQEQLVREALAESVAWHETVRAAEELAPVMVAQSGTVVAAPVVVPSFMQQGWRTAAGWVALGAAACLALVFAAQQMHRPAERPAGEIAAAQTDADSHLLAALSFDGSVSDPSPLVARLHADATQSEADDAFDVPPSSELDVTAPDWLLAAVAESSEFGGNE